MTLLILYVVLALLISFFCSIFEAVLLSVTPSYIAHLKHRNPQASQRLAQQKDHVDESLIAILTFNTIAHTSGAAGAGAQAALVYGDEIIGVFSAILTFLILFFSEIIPKTIGANYWRQLAPLVSWHLVWLVVLTRPFIWLSLQITRRLRQHHQASYIRQEMSAMAEIGKQSGELNEQESDILKQMLKAREVPVTAVMTPRTVLFSLNQDTTVSEFAQQYMLNPFARIPIYQDKSDDIVGYVLRNDILVSEKVKPHKTLKKLKKQILAIPETVKLLALFDLLMKKNMQLALVVDEYGSTLGLITIEDIIESLLGLEIVDSKDPAVDMQHLARRKWQQRMQQKGIVLSEDEQKVPHSQQTKPKD